MIAEDFLRDYDCVAICGCFRYGSTALASKINRWIKSHGHASLWLNEFFAGHHFLIENPTGDLVIEDVPMNWIPLAGSNRKVVTSMQRPIPEHLMRLKIGWLTQTMTNRKMVIKLDPSDWSGESGRLLEDFVFGNPRVYPIGLNRQDVGNAMISYVIGEKFNFWIYNEDEFRSEWSKPVTPIAVAEYEMQVIYSEMLLHNNWLWYSRDHIPRLVWYDEIPGLTIPEIGMQADPGTWSYKHHVPHGERAAKYFTNHDAVMQMAADMQHALDGIIRSVKQRYRS